MGFISIPYPDNSIVPNNTNYTSSTIAGLRVRVALLTLLSVSVRGVLGRDALKRYVWCTREGKFCATDRPILARSENPLWNATGAEFPAFYFLITLRASPLPDDTLSCISNSASALTDR